MAEGWVSMGVGIGTQCRGLITCNSGICHNRIHTRNGIVLLRTQVSTYRESTWLKYMIVYQHSYAYVYSVSCVHPASDLVDLYTAGAGKSSHEALRMRHTASDCSTNFLRDAGKRSGNTYRLHITAA